MKKLLEEIEKNQELKAKIQELDKNPESTPKDYIQVAAEYGIALTQEDFKPTEGEVTDDELDAVAGGKLCICVIGGGGEANTYRNTKTCACVIGGGGQDTDGESRCNCVIGGAGG